MCQHYFGTKRGNYYMMTTRRFTAKDMLDFGMVSEVVPKGRCPEARMGNCPDVEDHAV